MAEAELCSQDPGTGQVPRTYQNTLAPLEKYAARFEAGRRRLPGRACWAMYTLIRRQEPQVAPAARTTADKWQTELAFFQTGPVSKLLTDGSPATTDRGSRPIGRPGHGALEFVHSGVSRKRGIISRRSPRQGQRTDPTPVDRIGSGVFPRIPTLVPHIRSPWRSSAVSGTGCRRPTSTPFPAGGGYC